MRTYKTEGIIIRRNNYKESDRMITIFTKHYGKIKVLAKGVRKIYSRRGPNIEFFNRVEVSLYNGKFIDMVMEVKTIDAYANLKKCLSNISKAWEICELVDLLTREKQEHREVFDLMTVYLNKLNFSQNEVMIDKFKYALLHALGFISEFYKTSEEIDSFIESLAERRLRTKKIYG